MKDLLFASFVLIALLSYAQPPTIGLRYYDANAEDGYTLFTPQSNKKVYLINNCGEVQNEWEFSEKPGLTCYLLEDGNLLRAGKDSVEVRDWDNNLVWSFHVNSLGVNQHHDIEPLPNGNVLLLLFDVYDAADMFDIGLRTSYTESTFKMDKVIELEPDGIGGANVVWEWKFFDHLIQDFDNTKPNFGVVNNNPQLLNVNYLGESVQDFTHCNAIDYNADLDQIMLSARHTNEIYIIDHSTTTLEAAGHTGGTYGKGGDFLWRWGNPETYANFTSADQQLGKQHDCKWIEEGVHTGKISVFSNESDGSTTGVSAVYVLDVPHSSGVYQMSNNKYLPDTYDWSWSGSILGEVMYDTKKCGAQILPNGGALIAETGKGKISEISANGDVLWVYTVPHGLTLLNQFDSPSDNGVFRAHKYPVNYPGFDNVNFTNTGIIENTNSVSQNCIDNLGLLSLSDSDISIFPNPASSIVKIQGVDHIQRVTVINQLGEILIETTGDTLDIENLSEGIYTVSIVTPFGIATKPLVKL